MAVPDGLSAETVVIEVMVGGQTASGPDFEITESGLASAGFESGDLGYDNGEFWFAYSPTNSDDSIKVTQTNSHRGPYSVEFPDVANGKWITNKRILSLKKEILI